MKTKFFFALVCATCLLVTSCTDTSSPEPLPKPDDPTRFNGSSIVGVWACIATDNAAYDIISHETLYSWDYDPDAETYDVMWYFDIKNDSQVKYVNVKNPNDKGEYRKSDQCLHVPANVQWATLVDAKYEFDEVHQSIRCFGGKFLGFYLESVESVLGNDTIYYVRRYGLDEAAIMDNTGFFQSQYVVRVNDIIADL